MTDSDTRPAPNTPSPPGFRPGLIVLSLLGVILLQDWMASRTIADIPYSEFRDRLERGEVEQVVVGRDSISGAFLTPVDGRSVFRTNRVDNDLVAELDAAGVEYTGRIDSTFLPMLLSWFIPILLILGIWMFIMRRASRGGAGPGSFMAVGKSKAKIYVETDTGTDFSFVAGVDEAKEELQEVVNFLRAPETHGRLGARMPKGVLLVGPPGTGKTLIARAVAGEAEVPFFSISGSEFVEMFVGVGAARVRDLFEQAREKSPCIIFIDELDALGRARGAGPMSGSNDEKEQTLNQLLVEMDGFDASSGIVILAATNRPETLDPALLRAGRFDRQVLVDRPDRNGRVAILVVHLAGITLDRDVDPEKVAALTAGFTGADLANLCNEAALVATRRSADSVSMADFTAAIERIVAGLEKKNRLLNPREREIVAHHEMGHAIVGAVTPGADPVHKVSIIPRGIGALGYTMQRPTDDRYLMTREELEGKLAVLMGGRAAEQLVYGHLSTGASDDLSRATEIARSMVTQYGMVPELGHAAYARRSSPFLNTGLNMPESREYSEATARRIDEAVSRLVDEAFERARQLLADTRVELMEGAALLLERETLDEDDLTELFGRARASAAGNPAPTGSARNGSINGGTSGGSRGGPSTFPIDTSPQIEN